MKKSIIRLAALVLLIAMLTVLAGCSGKNALAGEYTGTAGSYLKLSKDGTCVYSETDSTGAGTGIWYVEDGIIYIDVDNLDFVVYGDVSDFDGGILLESTAGRWNDEYFKKG